MALLLALLLSYGPYARPVNGGDAAVAAVRGGALVAWSEANRIHVSLLDAHARLSPDIHLLPATAARAVAVAPAAASDGASYLVAWIELESGLQRTMGMLVARDGSPIGTPRQYGKALTIASNDFAVRLVWDGAAYRLWGGGKALTVDRNGEVLTSADAAVVPSGVAASNGVVATSSARATLLGCGFLWCSVASWVTWTTGAKTDSVQVGYWTGPAVTPSRSELPLPPSVVAAARDRFVVAWPAPEGLRYLVTGDGTNLVAASPDLSVRPGLACDDTQCVLAYAQSNDVHAFAFPIDRLTGPELLTIAATERVERAPQVHVLGDGRFLVIYRGDGPDGTRLNWRVVTFNPARRRAVR